LPDAKSHEPAKTRTFAVEGRPAMVYNVPRNAAGRENTTVNDERVDENATGTLWTAAEENFLMLARELEWAEAYSADHPACPMGRVYLHFLQWEMLTAQGER
jgi:hypothetical protein